MANINIKTLISNGDGMATDHIFTEAQFEWFKSEEDGYIYTRNTETGRNTRFNAEGQNGKRISDNEYFTKCNEALERRNEMLLDAAEDPSVSVEEFCDLIAETNPEIAEEARAEMAAEEMLNVINRGLEEAKANAEAPKTEEKPKKTRKAKKSAAFRTTIDGVEITLTDKQVDFIKHLPDSNFWEDGVNSVLWTDVLCDEIGGQFEGKPMTVGAMISTICEKGLGVRTKDRINGRKATAFALTEKGKQVARTLGLW